MVIFLLGFTHLAFLLILAGAVGNIIDSVFYGVFFGYAPLFFGKVVDMFYFLFTLKYQIPKNYRNYQQNKKGNVLINEFYIKE